MTEPIKRGSLVRYDGGFTPEFGLFDRPTPSGDAAWVQFPRAGSRQSCELEHLTVLVEALEDLP